MNEAGHEILDILSKAYQIETDGHVFYSMVADRTQKQPVREVFLKLASDELLHKSYLKEIASRYEEVGVAAFLVQRASPDVRAFSQKVFTDWFRDQALGSTFEASALSIGMTLENNAMTHFIRSAEASSDNDVKDFYRFLAAWEQEHLNALHSLYQSVRADFFNDSGFEPF